MSKDTYTFRTSNFFPNAIGFDRTFKLLEDVINSASQKVSYPPYNIRSVGENKYVVDLAVAGFKQDEINITVEDNILTVSGKQQTQENEESFVYRGIAAREFKRAFTLMDNVEVIGAKLENGILSVNLEDHIPEKIKPKVIPIL